MTYTIRVPRAARVDDLQFTEQVKYSLCFQNFNFCLALKTKGLGYILKPPSNSIDQNCTRITNSPLEPFSEPIGLGLEMEADWARWGASFDISVNFAVLHTCGQLEVGDYCA